MAAQSAADVLRPLLRDVYDDDDFVEGVIAVAREEENRRVIIDFIAHAKDVGDEVTSDDLLMLAIYLADNGPLKRE